MENVCYLCGDTKVIQNYTGELYDCPECEERPMNAAMLQDVITANETIAAQAQEIERLKALIQKTMAALETKANLSHDAASELLQVYYMLEDGLKQEGK